MQVDGAAGKRASFEVTVDGTLVFSKLGRGGFPEFNKLTDTIEAFLKTGTWSNLDQIPAEPEFSCNIL